MYTHTYVNVYIYIHMYTHVYTCIYIYICIYIYVYIYIIIRQDVSLARARDNDRQRDQTCLLREPTRQRRVIGRQRDKTWLLRQQETTTGTKNTTETESKEWRPEGNTTGLTQYDSAGRKRERAHERRWGLRVCECAYDFFFSFFCLSHIRSHGCMYICIHIYLHINILDGKCTFACIICIVLSVSLSLSSRAFARICIFALAYILECIREFKYVQANVHYIHVYIYIHMHVYVYRCE